MLAFLNPYTFICMGVYVVYYAKSHTDRTLRQARPRVAAIYASKQKRSISSRHAYDAAHQQRYSLFLLIVESCCVFVAVGKGLVRMGPRVKMPYPGIVMETWLNVIRTTLSLAHQGMSSYWLYFFLVLVHPVIRVFAIYQITSGWENI